MSNAKFQNVSLKEKLDCALLQENTQKKLQVGEISVPNQRPKNIKNQESDR